MVCVLAHEYGQHESILASKSTCGVGVAGTRRAVNRTIEHSKSLARGAHHRSERTSRTTLGEVRALLQMALEDAPMYMPLSRSHDLGTQGVKCCCA